MQNTQLTNVQERTVNLVITNAAGAIAQTDGIPVWLSEEPAIATVTPAPDGMSAVLSTTGIVGETNINVIIDVDLGDGVFSQTGTFHVTVTESGEVTFTFSFGDAQHR